MEGHAIVRTLVFLREVTSDWKSLDQILTLLPRSAGGCRHGMRAEVEVV